MVEKTVQVLGLKELERTLDADFLVQPEMDSALESFQKRLMRQGKGLGAQRNTVAAAVHPLGATAQSTLHYPRTKGTSWGAKNERIIGAMAPRVFRKMAERVQERWAAQSALPPDSYEGLGG